MNNLKQAADRLLNEYGLWKLLGEYGEPVIVGSYRMDLMAVNDLDIDISGGMMTLGRLHELTGKILDRFDPVWYEAKREFVDGRYVYFHGFETEVLGKLWNVDLWFFDRDTIAKAVSDCDEIAEKVSQQPELRQVILEIKTDLTARGLYRHDFYTSMDVYDAVLHSNIRGTKQFIEQYKRKGRNETDDSAV